MRGCKVYFEISGLRLLRILETPLLGYSGILVGRKIINKHQNRDAWTGKEVMPRPLVWIMKNLRKS